MENQPTDFVLPPAPKGVCFNSNEFVKTDFSVDGFLTDHQDVASLETMRDDLGAYLKVLRLAMIELINRDYANFVNLCATLIGFDKVIVKIKEPLIQLNEEVSGVQQCLEEAMNELSMWLNQRHNLQKKKQLLKYYSQTINCMRTLENIMKDISEKNIQEQMIVADRAVMQYNQLKFSIAKCDSIVKSKQKMQYNEVGSNLVQTLNELLFKFLINSDEDNLLKVLVTLTSLDRVTETEMLLRKQAVAPLLLDIVSESALRKHKEGLQGIYKEILSLLSTKLKLLLDVTQHPKLMFATKKYRFLVNCFWCEVESKIEMNMSSIYAPGNPDVFYTRYCESMNFVKSLEEYCSEDTVQLLRQTSEYKSFLKRWNLPVYFQIRFQEIAGSYEASLQTSPAADPQNGFTLKESHNCWLAIQQCWSHGVYIDALAHKFWKLSLQLLSRFSIWASDYCTQITLPKEEQAETNNSMNRELLDNCINIYTDVQTLIQKLPELLQMVSDKLPIGNKDLLKTSLSCTETKLGETKKRIRECVVSELFGYCNVQLKQVSDIPRLYRKTNRSVPTKPCGYIDLVSKTLKEFHEDASKRLDHAFLVELFEDLFNVMTVSYFKYVEDVLTSVQKTEDSLRRLKQIREGATPQSSEGAGVTDGDKIRLQLQVDVTAYGALADTLRVDANHVQKFPELRSMVTEYVKNVNNK